jgi:hypothetical protein
MKSYQARSLPLSTFRLRLITANFGLDNSSYRAQPHSIIVNKWHCAIMHLTLLFYSVCKILSVPTHLTPDIHYEAENASTQWVNCIFQSVSRYNNADVYGQKLKVFPSNNWHSVSPQISLQSAEIPPLMGNNAHIPTPNTPSRRVQVGFMRVLRMRGEGVSTSHFPVIF